jgi:hypothetical protein
MVYALDLHGSLPDGLVARFGPGSVRSRSHATQSSFGQVLVIARGPIIATCYQAAHVASDDDAFPRRAEACPTRLDSLFPLHIVFAQIIYAKTKKVAMWANEHSVETSAAPEAIWRLWADVPGWPGWNGDIERIELDGPFAAGSRIVMIPLGDEPVELRIAEAVEPELFVDEAELGEIVVRTIHRVERLDNERARVTYRMEITGPAADTLGPQIGPEISADFPQTLAALVERAEA